MKLRITKNFSAVALTLLIQFFCFSLLFSQETWSLRKCIEYSKENNLSLKQAQNNMELTALTLKQNKLNRLPNITGGASGGYQFGRTIDPTTNSFNNQRISFNNYRVDASMPIFTGGQINNSIRQSEYDMKSAQADAAFSFNNTALNIANAYLQILMAEEQLANANKRKYLSEQQLDQTDKLIQAGTLPENDRLELLAQIARDDQTIIQSQNLIDLNYLNLKEFMQLDPNTEIKIETPDVGLSDMNPDTYNFRDVYSNAATGMPQILRDEMSLKSAELGVDIARGALLPTLSIFGGLDTRWSSASKIVTAVETGRVSQNVYLPGEPDPLTFEFEVDNPVFADNPFFDQLDQNFGQSLGLSLNVPIYNNGRNQINVERAKVGILNAKLQSDLTKQQLKVDVQNAIASAKAAKKSYDAANRTVEAANAAFQNAQKQYELGAINTFQFTTARNNLDIAEIDATVSKYDYIFRMKIIDFYLGKELNID